MENYKRLTKRAGWHKDIDLTDELGYSYIYQRLSELENKIEDGRLIEVPCKVVGDLPCKMGDKVWLVYKRHWNVADKIGYWVLRKSNVSPHNIKRITEDWGKYVFLTKEKAEARLKELQGERE